MLGSPVIAFMGETWAVVGLFRIASSHVEASLFDAGLSSFRFFTSQVFLLAKCGGPRHTARLDASQYLIVDRRVYRPGCRRELQLPQRTVAVFLMNSGPLPYSAGGRLSGGETGTGLAAVWRYVILAKG